VRPPTPAERLRSHVDRILDRASVRGGDREDLVEELYGHLWQRWQDGIAAGLQSDAAADAAISGFGEASRLGQDMTSAYHSRLYASTIGVLLPTVLGVDDKPHGYGRARALLFLTGLFAVVGGVVYLNAQTPFRLFFGAAAIAMAFCMTVLAYRAFARGQRWALVYVQVLGIGFVAEGVIEFLLKPVTISFLGIVSIFVLMAAFDPKLGSWVSASRRTGKALGAVIVGSVLLYSVPLAVVAMPDPTQASPADLSISVRVDCASTGGLVTSGTVTATIRWARTDFLPYGLRPGMSQTDQLDASSTSILDFDPGPNGTPFPSGFRDGVVITGNWKVVDAENGRNADAGGMMFSWPSFFPGGGLDDGIDPGTIQANRTYVASFGFLSQEPTGLPDDPVFRIRYDHQGRWGVQAYATCTQPGVGQPVTTPDPPTFPVP
jgi:hypothetical protein